MHKGLPCFVSVHERAVCSPAARTSRIWVGLGSALGAVPEFRGGGHSALEEWARPSRAEWAWS